MIECLTLGRKWRPQKANHRLIVLGVLLTLASPAHATYSLLAVDTDKRELGGFAISCIAEVLSLSEVIRLNESSIIAAQGYFFFEGRDELASQLERGASPSEAIFAALAPSSDPPGALSGASYRQYAALDLEGIVAQHSGADLSDFAGHITGTVGTISYAIQGNILTESGVLDRLEEGFSASGTGVFERAISSLGALADSGGGDSRCSPRSGDAGYFVWRTPGSAALEIEIVAPEEEVARVLAAEMAANLPEGIHDNSIPNGSNSDDDSAGGTGCAWTHARGNGGAALIWCLFVGVGLLLRRREIGAASRAPTAAR